ncbi:hypothetical protein DsansV1_C10g0100941 [Dioscorea sansibarensis]
MLSSETIYYISEKLLRSNKEQTFRWSYRGPEFILLVFKFYNTGW